MAKLPVLLKYLCPVVLLVILPACNGGLLSPSRGATPLAQARPLLDAVATPAAVTSESLLLAEEGVSALGARHLDLASDKFNHAIKLDPTNSGLHFLNGLTYHLRALQGDGSLFELAEEGYKLAVKFDQSNWVAHYHHGLLAMDRKAFVAAQNHLSEALLFNSHNSDMLYTMVVASYFAQDPQTAAGVLSKLREQEPDSERVLRAACMVEAALGNEQAALASLTQYRAQYGEKASPVRLSERVADWQRFYEHTRSSDGLPATRQPRFLRAAYHTTNEESAIEGEGNDAGARMGAPSELSQGQDPGEKMIIVDVVMIRTEENITTRKGVNLLNGLTIQFGNSDNPAYAWGRTKESSAKDSPFTTTTAITQALNIPAINYSMNIFNAHTDRSEVLARPTVIALNGEQSSFFSGLDIEAATVSNAANSGGSSVTISKKVGVRLDITPSFQDNGRIKLQVHALRTFLRTPSKDIEYQNKIETSETEVTASVVMNFGETLVLSGLSEKETERIRDGVPFLQDIPVLQYFFSQKDSRDFQRSVLIMLTPRAPQYVYRETGGEKTGTAGESESTPLNELQARYSDWFKPYPNWASVFHHMQSNSLYREFRTGDVTMETWENQQSFSDRLKQSFGFLYY